MDSVVYLVLNFLDVVENGPEDFQRRRDCAYDVLFYLNEDGERAVAVDCCRAQFARNIKSP